MKHRNLRLPAAVLLLALSLPAAAACQTPPAATPDTDGATLAEGTTAATTEAATTADGE